MQAIVFAVGLIFMAAIPFAVWIYLLNRKIEHEEAEIDRRTREIEAIEALKPTPAEELLEEVRELREELQTYFAQQSSQ